MKNDFYVFVDLPEWMDSEHENSFLDPLLLNSCLTKHGIETREYQGRDGGSDEIRIYQLKVVVQDINSSSDTTLCLKGRELGLDVPLDLGLDTFDE